MEDSALPVFSYARSTPGQPIPVGRAAHIKRCSSVPLQFNAASVFFLRLFQLNVVSCRWLRDGRNKYNRCPLAFFTMNRLNTDMFTLTKRGISCGAAALLGGFAAPGLAVTRSSSSILFIQFSVFAFRWVTGQLRSLLPFRCASRCVVVAFGVRALFRGDVEADRLVGRSSVGGKNTTIRQRSERVGQADCKPARFHGPCHDNRLSPRGKVIHDEQLTPKSSLAGFPYPSAI